MTSNDRNPELSPSEAARQDRNALRVEVSPQYRPTREGFAFQLGRLFNELRFQIQVAWIGCCDNVARIDVVWRDLNVLAKELCDSALLREKVESEIQNIREVWIVRFESEARSDWLHSLFCQLESHDLGIEEGTDEFGLFEAQVRQLPRLLDPILELAEEICGPDLFSIFGIGLLLDQAIHPPFHRSSIALNRQIDVVRPSWNETLTPTSSPSGCLPTSTSVGEHWKISEWWFKLKYAVTKSTVILDDQVKQILLEPRLPVSVDQVFDLISELFAHGSPEYDYARFLGLTLDSRNQSASRIGFDPTVRLQRREFLLLMYFVEQGNEPTSCEWLMRNRRRFGRRTLSNRNTVDAAISQLNANLNCFELTISPDEEGNGWTLGEN